MGILDLSDLLSHLQVHKKRRSVVELELVDIIELTRRAIKSCTKSQLSPLIRRAVNNSGHSVSADMQETA